MLWADKCDRCQKQSENRYKGTLRAKQTALTGGFHAVLCPECLNEWHLRFHDFPQYAALLAVDAELHAFDGRGREAVEIVRAALQRKSDLLREYYDHGQSFVAEAVTREPAEVPTED